MDFRRKPGSPITEANILNYIKEAYPEFEITSENTVILDDFEPVLQSDMSKRREPNCSLTSIASAINYLTEGRYDMREIYAFVRKVSRFFLYNPYFMGTISLAIAPIMSIARKHFNLPKDIGIGYIKGVGFTFEKIQRKIDKGNPVILSMFRDGRNFYKNHTVTVTGYRIYWGKQQRLLFLVLNDNWARERRFLDFKKLWVISSINY